MTSTGMLGHLNNQTITQIILLVMVLCSKCHHKKSSIFCCVNYSVTVKTTFLLLLNVRKNSFCIVSSFVFLLGACGILCWKLLVYHICLAEVVALKNARYNVCFFFSSSSCLWRPRCICRLQLHVFILSHQLCLQLTSKSWQIVFLPFEGLKLLP